MKPARLFLAGALAGVAAAVPFLHESVEFLAWVGPLPLFLLLACGRVGRGFVVSGAAGLAYVATGAFWLARIAGGVLVASALFFGGCFLAFTFIPWVRRRLPRLPLWCSVPLLWVFVESLKGFLGRGTWLSMGYTQAQFLPLIQVAEWTGVSGISLMVVLSSAALADLLAARRPGITPGERPALTLRLAGIGLAIALPAMASAWGAVRLREVREAVRPGPTVLMVQGNIPLGWKTSDNAEGVLATHLRLTREAVSPDIDLVIWPETMPIRPEHEDERTVAQEIAAAVSRPLLLGGHGVPQQSGERRMSNSAFLLGPDGGPRVRYDKQILVPFGEFIPFIDSLPALRRRLEQFIWDRFGFMPLLRPGTDQTLFPVDGGRRPMRFAVLICYEDTVPRIATAFARLGADFLVVLSNEHFYYPREMEQHVDMAVFRAVETRRSVLRATNTGLTVAIDPAGVVTARLDRDVEGTLKVAVPVMVSAPAPRRSTRVFGFSCGAALAVVLAVALARRTAPSGAPRA